MCSNLLLLQIRKILSDMIQQVLRSPVSLSKTPTTILFNQEDQNAALSTGNHKKWCVWFSLN